MKKRSILKKGSGMLSFLVLSEKRKNLLLLLLDGPKTLEEIRSSLRVTSSGVIPQIRKMGERKLIHQENKKYVLTEIGRVVAKSFDRFNSLVEMFEEDGNFWGEHKISRIPEEFLLRIHELGEYEIFESSPTDIFRPHGEYTKNLLRSKWVKGVSPVLHPEYPKSILILAEKGVEVSIIVTEEVLEKLKEKHKIELEKSISYKNMRLMVCDEEVKVAFTVTNFFLSMRLFLKNDIYDFYSNIISHEKSALKWGDDLFNYYEKRSKRVESEDL